MANKFTDEVETIDLDTVNDADYAQEVLKDAEDVLRKRIGRMREGKPRSAAQAKLKSLQRAQKLLRMVTE